MFKYNVVAGITRAAGLKTDTRVPLLASLIILVLSPMFQIVAPLVYVFDASGNLAGSIIFDRDMTYEGDLILKGNTSVIIEDCNFEIKGRIRISDDSILILRNAKISLVESREDRREDGEFWFRMNDNSRFKAVNITIETISFQSFSIYISDEVEALFDDVYSLEWHGLICEEDSKVQIVDSTCWSMIETRDASVLSVWGSRIYGVNVTGYSSAFLKDVYTTRASVAVAGSLEVFNSTISSDTEGLELCFKRDTELTLHNFLTASSGIGYEFCDHWSLVEDNEASNVYINVTLNHVYLKLVQFVVTDGSDVSFKGIHVPHAKIICSAEDIEVAESTLKQVELLRECVLRARSVEFETLKASEYAFASIVDSKVGQVSGEDEIRMNITSSEIKNVASRDGAVLLLNNCSVLDSVSVSDNSIVLRNFQPISMDGIDYDLTEYLLNVRVANLLKEKTQIDMILDRDRIREMKNLKVLIDGESLAVDSELVKDLRTVSFMIPSGIWHLSISLGLVPPEHVPFFLSLVGQQLISLTIILILVIAVLLAWR